MKKFSTVHIICIALAAIMLLSLFPWPYGFYVLVRFIAMASFGYMAYSFYIEGRMSYAIAAGILALLFQPFAKIALGRDVWQVVDALVGLFLIVFVFIDRKHASPTLSKQSPQHNMSSPVANSIAGKWKNNSEYDVFISYATKDYFDDRGNVIPGNVISKVQDSLSAAGITYWIDKKRLMGGVQFPTEIAKQIKNAKVFLYISSANSNASTWTMNEIATANTYGKTIIPFLADHTPYSSSIMIYIAGIHYIDYASNPSRALKDLVSAIKAQM